MLRIRHLIRPIKLLIRQRKSLKTSPIKLSMLKTKLLIKLLIKLRTLLKKLIRDLFHTISFIDNRFILLDSNISFGKIEEE
jgi:hypothetical protein